MNLSGYTATLKNYIDGSWKTFVMGREVGLTEFKKPERFIDKFKGPSYEQRLYHELYKEVHWLFDRVNEAQVTGSLSLDRD